MSEDLIKELVVYDGLIAEAVDEIVRLQAALDAAYGIEPQINAVAWSIGERMGGRLPEIQHAAEPWCYDLEAAPIRDLHLCLLRKAAWPNLPVAAAKDHKGVWTDSECRVIKPIAWARINLPEVPK